MVNQDKKDGAMVGASFAIMVFAIHFIGKLIINGKHCVITEDPFLSFVELIVIIFVFILLYKHVWK